MWGIWGAERHTKITKRFKERTEGGPSRTRIVRFIEVNEKEGWGREAGDYFYQGAKAITEFGRRKKKVGSP